MECNGRITSCTYTNSAAQAATLHSTNFAARLDEFRDMRNGWLEGEGSAPSHAGLDWLVDRFTRHFPNEAPLPYVYPTVGGGIRMEWPQEDNVLILEADIEAHKGEWLRFSRSSEDCMERTLELDNPGDWSWLAFEIIKQTNDAYPSQPS